MGRLSNPSEAVKRLVLQGPGLDDPSRNASYEVPKRSFRNNSVVPIEEEGRLSNPVQKRLPTSIVDELVDDYVRGLTINTLAGRYNIHRTTVMTHLKSRGVERGRSIRKMSDASVAQAAILYAKGLSLAKVAKEFGVSEGTVTREFRSTGLLIRPRRGWK